MVPNKATNVCWGDTGGPLAKDGIVYGIALFGFSLCNIAEAPEIHVKVADHVDWIKKYVNNM